MLLSILCPLSLASPTSPRTERIRPVSAVVFDWSTRRVFIEPLRLAHLLDGKGERHSTLDLNMKTNDNCLLKKPQLVSSLFIVLPRQFGRRRLSKLQTNNKEPQTFFDDWHISVFFSRHKFFFFFFFSFKTVSLWVCNHSFFLPQFILCGSDGRSRAKIKSRWNLSINWNSFALAVDFRRPPCCTHNNANWCWYIGAALTVWDSVLELCCCYLFDWTCLYFYLLGGVGRERERSVRVLATRSNFW
jgi:hypothetical protein